jgi:hypothetical protein
MIRDCIVFHVLTGKTREKLINEGEQLTLDKAIQIFQNVQYAQEQHRMMSQSGALYVTSADNSAPVHVVNRSSMKRSGALLLLDILQDHRRTGEPLQSLCVHDVDLMHIPRTNQQRGNSVQVQEVQSFCFRV